MYHELSFISLFEQFIKDSANGKRLKPNGQKIKPQTIDNYKYILALIDEFSQRDNFQLRIRTINRLSKKQLEVELNYWKKFYRRFSIFLAKEKGCYDNYIGMVFKTIRVFFNYLKKDKMLSIGEFYKNFYVRKEEIPVVTLMPNQLQFLISDQNFEHSLSTTMKRTKDLFVFGCTVALRYSDLINLRFRDIDCSSGQPYLICKSIKMENITRIKLPDYALQIVEKNRKRGSQNSPIFKNISISQANKNIRKLIQLAGWTHVTGKTRKQNGKDIEQYSARTKEIYRFCDLVSSHVMRRTAITTMLMLGMPEHVVRKISGHSANSKAFYRYVNFVQSYLDQEIDKVYQQLSLPHAGQKIGVES